MCHHKNKSMLKQIFWLMRFLEKSPCTKYLFFLSGFNYVWVNFTMKLTWNLHVIPLTNMDRCLRMIAFLWSKMPIFTVVWFTFMYSLELWSVKNLKSGLFIRGKEHCSTSSGSEVTIRQSFDTEEKSVFVRKAAKKPEPLKLEHC
jgi:hypothetical protein